MAEDDASDEAAVGPVLLIDGGDGSAPALAAIADGLTARGVSVVTGADEDPARLLDSVLAADEPDLGGPDLGGIVYVAAAGAGEEDEADPAEASLQRLGWLLRLVQETVSAEVPLPLGLTVVTAGGVAAEPVPGEAVDPEQASIWGFVRSVQTEQPQLGLRLLDMEPGAATDEELIALLAGAGPDPQLALRGGQLLAPRLGRTAGLAEASPTIRGDSSYLVTGGLGALGLEAAGWLARSGAGHVVLAGRRAPDTTVQERLTELEAQTGCVIATACVDVSDGAAVAALVGRFAANDVPTDTTEERTVEPSASETLWPPLAGVIHAAGVLDDGVVTAQTGERLACVLGPKARGAWHLHEASLDRDLDLFVLYSSVAATLGSPGQSNYAAANGFLDGLAAHRQSLGLAATSVAWGPWSSGMTEDAAVKASMARQGLRPLSAGPAQGALARLLAGGRSFGVVLDADWRRMGEGLGAVRPAMLSGLLAAPTALQAGSGALLSRLRQTPASERGAVLVDFVQETLQAVLGLADVPPASAGFFDLGLDSLMAVELRNRLNAALDGAYEAPNTVAFDHPTVDKLARHLGEKLGALGEDTVVRPPALAAVRRRDDEPIAIVGLACRLPEAADAASFWDLLVAGRDTAREVPRERWDIEAYYDPDPEAPGKMYMREASFLGEIDRFDAGFFGISPREATYMDPQQRLLLETAWAALEDAGLPAAGLSDSRTGVFTGSMWNEYAQWGLSSVTDMDAYMGTGSGGSFLAGRLAFQLGLQGPAMPVDTACSSSLVAIHLACQALRRGECEAALAAGVNLMLSPEVSIMNCRLRAVSPDGRCKAFDARADGYGRGEGVGVVVLKRLSAAERDGDRIHAVIRGSAVNHNGPSAGLTVPNGEAQLQVIAAALADARVAPEAVGYLEAHGTGTSLGDPIELRGALAVYGQNRTPEHPLLIGSVKTNIGHLEGAAGIAGLIKTVLALEHGQIPKTSESAARRARHIDNGTNCRMRVTHAIATLAAAV